MSAPQAGRCCPHRRYDHEDTVKADCTLCPPGVCPGWQPLKKGGASLKGTTFADLRLAPSKRGPTPPAPEPEDEDEAEHEDDTPDEDVRVRVGWGRTHKSSKQGDLVRCDDCKRRLPISLERVLRSNQWPICCGQVMRFLNQDEAEALRRKEPEFEERHMRLHPQAGVQPKTLVRGGKDAEGEEDTVDREKQRKLHLFHERHPTPEARREAIRARLRAGETQRAIAQELGLTKQRISHIIRKDRGST